MAQRISFFLVPNLAKQVDTSIIFFDLRRVIVEIPRQALGDFVNWQVIEDQVDFSDRSPGQGGLLCAWRVNNIAGWNGR